MCFLVYFQYDNVIYNFGITLIRHATVLSIINRNLSPTKNNNNLNKYGKK